MKVSQEKENQTKLENLPQENIPELSDEQNFFLNTMKTIVRHFNKEYGMEIRYSGFKIPTKPHQTISFRFSGPCIFKPDSDDRVLQVFGNERTCTFYCHHENCRKDNSYLIFEKEMQSMFVKKLLDSPNNNETIQIQEDLGSFFAKLCNKSFSEQPESSEQTTTLESSNSEQTTALDSEKA